MFNFKCAVVLMTSLVPTIGHRDLIDFALNLDDVYEVNVIINCRTFEPTIYGDRAEALSHSIASKTGKTLVFHHHLDDSAPQNPPDHPDFWGYWRKIILECTDEVPENIVIVASEPYGADVARSLNAEFIPYDLDRDITPVYGRLVRDDPVLFWGDILPEFRRNYQIRTTFFGQESVGKTTISRKVHEILRHSRWFPEYARPYLETVGSELTQEKMSRIWSGQYAIQYLAAFKSTEYPYIIQDTDLYSTVGYLRIGNFDEPLPLQLTMAKGVASDVYYVLPDDVPFEVDELRYGGDVRESTRDFWIDICEEFSLNYVLVPEGTMESKIHFIVGDITSRFNKKWYPIKRFKRE